MPKIKLQDGREVQAERLSFRAESEPWCHYVLEDGTAVRLRLNLKDALIIPPNPEDPEGKPQHHFFWDVSVHTIPKEDL